MIADKLLWAALFTVASGSGAVTGWLTAHASRDDATERPGGGSQDPAWSARLEELGARLDDLEARAVGRSASVMPARTEVAASIDEARLRALVDAALAEHGLASAALAADGDVGAEEAVAVGTSSELVEQILELGVRSEDAQALWEAAHAEGRLEELVAAFEAWAAARPDSPDAQAELARAYTGAAQQDPNRPNGGWWASSDRAYTAALNLDPNHWDARSEKAVSLTHWPDMWGRRPEAIRHFETLIEQARTAPVAQAKHARPFLYLGNLLAHEGKREEAERIWAEGLRRFPDDDDLRSTVGR